MPDKAETLEKIIEQLYDYEFEEVAEYLQESDTSTPKGRKRLIKGIKGRIKDYQQLVALMQCVLILFPE